MTPFVPRPPWRNGDLQTLRNSIVRPIHSFARWPGERMLLTMRDGSGDRLAASLHRPRTATDKPLAILIAGVTGCEGSIYIKATATALLKAGYPVLRLNLRGSPPSRPTCRDHYHAGRSEDLRDVVEDLPLSLKSDGLVVIGYSMGGNMILKCLGEDGEASPFMAAASVSAPIDLFATTRQFTSPRNAVYHQWMLNNLKKEALVSGADITADERNAVLAARNVIEYDDLYVARRNGFNGAEDYYQQCQALTYLDAIRIPTLIIHADDDPWIPSDAYRQFDWASNPWLKPELTHAGGHVGFHARGSKVPWHDQRILAFLNDVTRR